MLTLIHKGIAKVLGRNLKSAPASLIQEQMHEKRELPMGRQAFEEWSDRLIGGAMIPGATPDSLKFALATMLMHLGPTVDHECDAYFIKSLRKGAINQVAHAVMIELKEKQTIRAVKDEAANA